MVRDGRGRPAILQYASGHRRLESRFGIFCELRRDRKCRNPKSPRARTGRPLRRLGSIGSGVDPPSPSISPVASPTLDGRPASTTPRGLIIVAAVWWYELASPRAGPSSTCSGGGGVFRCLFILGSVPWAGALVWLAGLSWFLTDDAFISFRYARNLLEGHGLVFNPGEYVEGYSNFLWVLELAAAWGLFGVRPEVAAPWLSVACTGATLAVMLWWVVHTPSLRHRSWVAWMALGLVCTSATFAVVDIGRWAGNPAVHLLRGPLGGMPARAWAPPPGAVGGLAGPGGGCLDPARGPLDRRLLLRVVRRATHGGDGTAAAGPGDAALARVSGRAFRHRGGRALRVPLRLLRRVAAQHVLRQARARVVRVGHPLSVRGGTGNRVLPAGASRMRRVECPVEGPARSRVCPAPAVHRRAHGLPHAHRRRPLRVSAARLLLAFAGSARRGGDRAPGRADSGSSAPRGQGQGQGRHSGCRARDCSSPCCSMPPWSRTPGCTTTPKSTTRATGRSSISPSVWSCPPRRGRAPLFTLRHDLVSALARRYVGTRALYHRRYARQRIREWSPYEHVERDVIPDDAVAAMGAIGIPPFYISALVVVDTYGLTDATVARHPVTLANRYREIAHDRRPPPGYLDRRGVNFMPHPLVEDGLWALARANYAVRVGPDLWMPFDATDHQWTVDRFSGRELRVASDFDGIRVLADFEDGLDGWQPNGDGIVNSSLHDFSLQIPSIGYSGRGFLTSFHPRAGDAATGTARSPEFTAGPDDHLSFLLGGGGSENMGVRLLVDGVEVRIWHGPDGLTLRPIVHRLAEVAGKDAATGAVRRRDRTLGLCLARSRHPGTAGRQRWSSRSALTAGLASGAGEGRTLRANCRAVSGARDRLAPRRAATTRTPGSSRSGAIT